MPDPTKNVKQYTLYGFIIGIFLALLANGVLIIKTHEDDGLNLARLYVWILPAIGGILISIDQFTSHKIGTKMRGFFNGFSIITTVINVVGFELLPLIITKLQSA